MNSNEYLPQVIPSVAEAWPGDPLQQKQSCLPEVGGNVAPEKNKTILTFFSELIKKIN